LRMKAQGRIWPISCTVWSDSDTCSEVPTTVLSELLSAADGQVIIARTDIGLLMDTQRLNELVTKCDSQI
jgi:hypothetical protein